MSLPYGFQYKSEGSIGINEENTKTVRVIYQQYLSGKSLKGISDFLFAQGIPSPKGKARWTQAAINSLLSNQKYVGAIVSFDEFFLVQGSKGNCSSVDEDTHKRKATRYSSQSVLSGLFICAECGHSYRRITRPSGEVVWRCANRVEHGKQFCKHSPSISEQSAKEAICQALGLDEFNNELVKGSVDFILVQEDGTLQIELLRQALSQYEIALNRYLPLRAGFLFQKLFQAELSDPPVEGGPAHTQAPGRRRQVAAAFPGGIQNPQGLLASRGGGQGLLADVQDLPDRRYLNPLSRVEDGQPQDGVAQLPHIPRPVVVE